MVPRMTFSCQSVSSRAGAASLFIRHSKRGVCLEGEGGPDPSVADLVIDFSGAPWFLQPSLLGGTACLACPRAGSLFLPSFGLREF